MSRNKVTTQFDRFAEFISRAEGSTNSNSLKLLEPLQPIIAVKEKANG
ncbi:MAG TPA: hypothetical protein V6C91_00545 [Coleofasciculaceae cyanobacterium]